MVSARVPGLWAVWVRGSLPEKSMCPSSMYVRRTVVISYMATT